MRQAEQVVVVSRAGERQLWQVIRTLRRVRELELECDTFVAELPSIYTPSGRRAWSTPEGYELDGIGYRPSTESDRYERVLDRMNRRARSEGVVIW